MNRQIHDNIAPLHIVETVLEMDVLSVSSTGVHNGIKNPKAKKARQH